MSDSEKTYLQKALDFLEETCTSLTVTFKDNGFHFEGDTSVRDRYEVTLKRGERSYTFMFGQSIMNSAYYKDKGFNRTFTLNGKERTGGFRVTDIKYLKNYCEKVNGKAPDAYSILACLTLYNPGTLEDFCSEFGYDTDSKKATRIYERVREEWLNVCCLFSDKELDYLREIV